MIIMYKYSPYNSNKLIVFDIVVIIAWLYADPPNWFSSSWYMFEFDSYLFYCSNFAYCTELALLQKYVDGVRHLNVALSYIFVMFRTKEKKKNNPGTHYTAIEHFRITRRQHLTGL